MRVKMSTTYVFFIVGYLCLSGCAPAQPDISKATSHDEENTESAVAEIEPSPPIVTTPSFSRPSFADMININTPLAVVEGDYTPLPYKVNIAPSLTDALSAFAQDRGNYALIVWHNGDIKFETYNAPQTSETRAESASMHKSVASLLIGAAIADGYIESVETPIGTFIPKWSNDPRGQITLRNVLEMNSGLAPLSYEGGAEAPAKKFGETGGLARDIMLEMQLSGTPGETFHYQNSVSQLLGMILETATGQSYQSYLSERLWKPIHAKEAKVWLYETEGFPRTYSSLYATPRDWLRLGVLIKDGGKFEGQQVIPEGYIRQMTAPSPTNVNYGWHIWRGDAFENKRYYNEAKLGFAVPSRAPFILDDIVYFDGFGGQRVYISTAHDLVIVRTGDAKLDWDDTALPNLVAEALTLNP